MVAERLKISFYDQKLIEKAMIDTGFSEEFIKEAFLMEKGRQELLGHKDVSTTLNIYTDVTKELRKSEFEGLELQFNQ